MSAVEPEPSDVVARSTRLVLRPIGNPLPLGFLALAVGTTVVSGLQLGWIPPPQGSDVALIVIAFVVPLQLVASVFGFLGRDVVAGTGMGLLAGTWLSIGLVQLTAAPGSTSKALGLLLLIAGTTLLVPAATAASAKVVPALVIATSAVRLALTGIQQLTASDLWEDVAGIVGLVLGGLALYAGLALAIEDATRRTVLPVGRRGFGRSSLDGNLPDQLVRLEGEAGIREQL